MNKSKKKGTAFESGCVRYLRASGVDGARRAALAGAQDAGDIHGISARGGVGVIECKNVKSLTPSLLEAYKRETIIERANAHAAWAALIVHEPGCDATGQRPSFDRNSAYLTLRDLTRLQVNPHDEAILADREVFFSDEVWARISVHDFARMIREA